ncbi:amino acid racemase [Iocasia frigidifontis]|uniref:Amino acid racemase n=1 Tax=Iocasia fonsfrigidae TaxID=2682810 RepID=A0A8A7K6U0_9FIRM|nr:aspartate/glutamate racemase family protein [Iocasia fonsfrigidae]QTL97503.1 amino acid racemase [Iocasia fonsfrigidae]
MKTIGLIGGMSWESSLEYYRIINEAVKKKLGEPHSCKSVMYSVDFAEYEKLQHKGKWELLTSKMIDVARKLEKAGVDLILICTNTMHKMAADVQKSITVPLLHIADAAAEEIKAKNMNKVGLLGTKFTMEENFYKERLKEKYGIDVVIPDAQEREVVHNVIYKELISGIIKEESRDKFRKIIKNLKKNGGEGVILGCTEIPLLIKNEDSEIPIFDTTMLHAKKAVDFALEQNNL